MTVNGAFINAIGTAVPANKISQQQFYSTLLKGDHWSRGERLLLRNIYNNCGISYRYSVLSEFSEDESEQHQVFFPQSLSSGIFIDKRMELFRTFSSQLAIEAIQKAFAKVSYLDKSAVTHLITFSCTGLTAPGLDISIAEEFGLNPSLERTCINFMGCYAAISALRTANHIVRAVPDAVVLLCGVELCTLHYSPGKEQDQLVANALFGDGAAAVIVTGKSGPTKSEVDLNIQNFYTAFQSNGNEMMTWNLGPHSFDLRLSSYVPDLIEGELSQLVEQLFSGSKTTLTDIDLFAIHPGGVKILEACEKALSLRKEQNKTSYDILDSFGNMSSVTVLFVLEKLMQDLTAKDKNCKILSAAFGPGLTVETMLLETV